LEHGVLLLVVVGVVVVVIIVVVVIVVVVILGRIVNHIKRKRQQSDKPRLSGKE